MECPPRSHRVATSTVVGGRGRRERPRCDDGRMPRRYASPPRRAPSGYFAWEAAGPALARGRRGRPRRRGPRRRPPPRSSCRHLDAAPATPEHAEALGRGLATTHAAGAAAFGAGPDGLDGRRLARAPQRAAPAAARRLGLLGRLPRRGPRSRPLARTGRDRGVFDDGARGRARPARRPRSAGGALDTGSHRPDSTGTSGPATSCGPRTGRRPHRPGGARRAPRGRPRHARALRRARTSTGCSRRTTRPPPRRRAGATGCCCTRCTRCCCTPSSSAAPTSDRPSTPPPGSHEPRGPAAPGSNTDAFDDRCTPEPRRPCRDRHFRRLVHARAALTRVRNRRFRRLMRTRTTPTVQQSTLSTIGARSTTLPTARDSTY